MSIKDKLNLDRQIDSISFQPNKGIKRNLYWSAAVGFFAFVELAIFWQQLGVGGRLVCGCIITYVIIFGFIDITFRLHVRYTFDKASNAIYKENLILGKHRIMKMDEATIFQSSEIGEWHYSLGRRKKEFLKSYTISPSFFERKASELEAEEYEREILLPIIELIGGDNVLSPHSARKAATNHK